tara:strand:+ start:9630 stop:9788 length:159 start_codon:yes stop_codon:yes gene_type:complete
MVGFRQTKRGYESTRSWATKAAAEKVRKAMPLSNNFKVFRSRRDGRFRIKID